MRLLVVGERNNLSARPQWDAVDAARWLALSKRIDTWVPGSPSWERLRNLGIDLDECDSLNLTPPAPQGVPFDMAKAMEVAELLIHEESERVDRRVIVACGNRVTIALTGLVNVSLPPYGTTWWVGGTAAVPRRVPVVRIPHPSGLSRVWNDELEVSFLQREMSGLLGRIMV